MKKLLLTIFLLVHQLVYCQTKTFTVSGSDYIKLIYSTLYSFENYKDSLKEKSYSIYDDSLKKMWDSKVIKKIDDYGQFPPLKVSELDTNFNFISELRDKIYLVNQTDAKDCYFMKNDSILIRKTLHKNHVWQQVEYGEYKIYKINLGNNRIVFWANGLGIIFKKSGILKTNFLPLEYFYLYGNANELVIKPKDSVNMETDYFDFGYYKVRLKQNTTTIKNNYTVTKNNQPILDDLNLKYYNQKTLMAFDKGLLKFYDLNLKIDSQFHYRTMTKGWDELEFLIDNKIKHISTQGFIATLPNENERGFGCGNVTHYTLNIGKTITEIVNGEMSGGSSYTKNITIQFPVQNDSMLFINQLRQLDWSDNGGFNDKILLFKKGKVGLYEFDLQDSLMLLKQILPIEFDKIHLLNGYIILNKNRQEEFYNYYIKTKKMRFNKIGYESSTYLRYQKIDKTNGWINSKGVLFDDE